MSIWRKLTGGLAVYDPRKPIGPDDLFPEEPAHPAPRIVRFLAADDSPRIGVVLESAQGRPRRILDLTARHGVGSGFMDLRRPSESYRKHLEQHRHAFGFVAPGDRVSGWITGLGRQE
jgi:hypothetical protein